MAWFQVSFFSAYLSRSVPLNVLIPADMVVPAEGAAAEPAKRYRTLYLLHGYLGNYTDWLLNTQINEMAQQFDLAVVMPSGDNGFYVDQPQSGIRGSEFLGCELVDFTRKIFPLSQKSEDTIIAGLSMGGYGAIYNGFKHSDVFGHAIALSAPVGLQRVLDTSTEPPEMGLHAGFFEALHGDLSKIKETDRNLELFAKNLLESGRALPDLYVACGYNDMLVHDNRAFDAYLTSIHFPHVYEEGPGTHEWPFWNTFLRRGLCHAIPEGPVILPNPFWIESAARVEGGI